ncbi:MAG: sterol desaturase family protein [Actinomycetota bacterium]|nr:sterol desaturase family protein [Actinomycetota bacterium]
MSRARTTATAGAFAVLGGALWTLVEYVMHRFAMHAPRGRGRISRDHLDHHADPDATSAPLRALLYTVVALPFLAAGWALGRIAPRYAAVAAGTYAGFAAYEQVHWRAHHRAPSTRWSATARQRHFAHHFGAPTTNYGVTTNVWDHLFRTWRPPGVVAVPRRLAPSWMVDEHGRVQAAHAERYRLVGSTDPHGRRAALDRARAYADVAPAD